MQSIQAALVSLDLSSRGKRRKAVTLIIGLLKRIHEAEETYMARMPLNLRCSDAFDTTEYFIDMLGEAIDVIGSIYD